MSILPDFMIRELRERVAILEEENRQLRDALAPVYPLPPAWGLRPGEAKFLRAIRRAAPSVLTRSAAMTALYGLSDDAPSPEGLDTVRYHLRRKLEGAGIVIDVVRSVGWRMGPEACTAFDAACASTLAAPLDRSAA